MRAGVWNGRMSYAEKQRGSGIVMVSQEADGPGEFSFFRPQARFVALAGDFNGWHKTSMPLETGRGRLVATPPQAGSGNLSVPLSFGWTMVYGLCGVWAGARPLRLELRVERRSANEDHVRRQSSRGVISPGAPRHRPVVAAVTPACLDADRQWQ